MPVLPNNENYNPQNTVSDRAAAQLQAQQGKPTAHQIHAGRQSRITRGHLPKAGTSRGRLGRLGRLGRGGGPAQPAAPGAAPTEPDLSFDPITGPLPGESGPSRSRTTYDQAGF